MRVEMLLPDEQSIDLEDLGARLSSGSPAKPFDTRLTDLLIDLSQRIFRDREAREFPELLAVAYWTRKAEVARLVEQFDGLRLDNRVLVPRGLVFHLPPRNVGTIFIYSWILAALTGNTNVIRLSPLRSESTTILLRLLGETLEASGAGSEGSTTIVSYGHDEAPTEMLSAICDVRVIWGGDATVETIRRSPLAPHARELTFPDRYSLAVVGGDAYADLPSERKDYLADQFFNDAFWFDQLACSSPRLVVWCGGRDATTAASGDFFRRLAHRVEKRGYNLPAAGTMQKFTFACGAALDLPVGRYARYGEVAVLTLESLEGFRRDHPGGGLFFEVHLNDLRELAPFLIRRDQTLTWFGFSAEELRGFVRNLNARSIDHVVPIGQALQFHRFWDGHDLLQEFCRCVHLETAPMAFR